MVHYLFELFQNGIRKSENEEKIIDVHAFYEDMESIWDSFYTHGLPAPSGKYGFIDATFGIELTRSDVVQFIKKLKQKEH